MRPVLLPSVGQGIGSLYVDMDAPSGATLRLVSTNPLTFEEVAGGTLTNGDKGDLTVTDDGDTFTIDDGAVTLAKMANLAQDKIIGRSTASTGVPEAIDCTAFARTLLDDANATAALATLGLTLTTTTKKIILLFGAPGVDLAVGDGQAMFTVPVELNGWTLSLPVGDVATAGTTGTMDFQLRRVRAGAAVDILSTKLTFDSTEATTRTAAAAAVVNASNDDLATGDKIFLDIDAVQTTAAKGLGTIEFLATAP